MVLIYCIFCRKGASGTIRTSDPLIHSVSKVDNTLVARRQDFVLWASSHPDDFSLSKYQVDPKVHTVAPAFNQDCFAEGRPDRLRQNLVSLDTAFLHRDMRVPSRNLSRRAEVASYAMAQTWASRMIDVFGRGR